MGAKAARKVKQELEDQDIWRDGAMNIQDAAKHLGVSQRSVYNEVYSGKLARSKIRGRTVVSRRQLDALLREGAGQ